MTANKEIPNKTSSSKDSDRFYGINCIDTDDMKELETLARESVKREPSSYSILIGNGIVFGVKGKDCEEDIEKTVKEIAKLIDVSVGGSGNEFKSVGSSKEDAKEVYKKFLGKELKK
jgi:alanyl-tRNA synthetase